MVLLSGAQAKPRHPLVKSRGEVDDLSRLAVVNAQAEEVGFIAIARLGGVSDVAAVGRVLRRRVGARIVAGDVQRFAALRATM